MQKSSNVKIERNTAVKAIVLALASVGLASLPMTGALANPQDGKVVAGTAIIRQETPNKVDITQTTDKAIIDWRSFNIGTKEQVQFYQPSSSSVTLNRVVGTDPSQILGRLTANGQVFLVNPNGIYFGKNTQIDVAGLVASTHNIHNEDFLSGRYNFNIPGKPGAAVINEGMIRIADTGIAAFVAPSVANRGVIVAKLGKIALSAANGFTLDFTGDQLLTFLVSDKVAKTAFDIEGKQLTSFVENSGRIEAQGGYILLSAKAAENAIHSVINQSGTIEATTVGTHNGEIILNAGKGSLSVTGTLDASAPNGGDGGFIETSGAHVAIDPNTKITTAASIGKTGVWLIDPANFTIAATGGDLTGTALATALGLNNVVIQSNSGATGTTGDINVNDSVNWSAHKLTLNAQNNININADLNGTGTASLALEYGQGSVAAGNLSDYLVNSTVNLPAGQNFSTKLGLDGVVKSFTVITSLGAEGSRTWTDLQGMSTHGNYVLGANIDATATTGWNAGAGFEPIGGLSGSVFWGTFDGMGHTISNLVINRPATNYVGLFEWLISGAMVKNVGLVGGSVNGFKYVGGLVAVNEGAVINSYSTSSVNGSSIVGGLVGSNGGSISNSYASGSVSSVEVETSGCGAGGLVCENGGSISNSYATGGVSSTAMAGAGAGANAAAGGLVCNNSGTIVGSYATGSANGKSEVGGLVGNNNGEINNSYSTGNVIGVVFVGGLIGYNSGNAANSYWDITTSGQATSAGGTGLTTAQMQQQASFSGWDFVNTWEILPGATHPTLRALNEKTVSPLPPVVPPPSNLTPAQTLLIQQHQNDNPAMLLNAIGDGLFANSTSDPVWTGMYQNGLATPAQITANSLWPTYDKYRLATASKVLEGLVNGDIVYGSTIWTALGSPSSGNMNNRNVAYYTFTHPVPTSTLTVAQQALVDAHKNDSAFQLLLAVADGLFTNSNQDPVWVALYQSGSATAVQVEANNLRNTYDAYTPADIFSLIRAGQLKNDSTDNAWHAIYRNGSATAAQVTANGFANTYDKYKGTSGNALFNGIISGDISPNSTASNAVVWQALVKQNLSGTTKAAQMVSTYNLYKNSDTQTIVSGLITSTLVASDNPIWVALAANPHREEALKQYQQAISSYDTQTALYEKYKVASVNEILTGLINFDLIAGNNISWASLGQNQNRNKALELFLGMKADPCTTSPQTCKINNTQPNINHLPNPPPSPNPNNIDHIGYLDAALATLTSDRSSVLLQDLALLDTDLNNTRKGFEYAESISVAYAKLDKLKTMLDAANLDSSEIEGIKASIKSESGMIGGLTKGLNGQTAKVNSLLGKVGKAAGLLAVAIDSAYMVNNIYKGEVDISDVEKYSHNLAISLPPGAASAVALITITGSIAQWAEGNSMSDSLKTIATNAGNIAKNELNNVSLAYELGKNGKITREEYLNQVTSLLNNKANNVDFLSNLVLEHTTGLTGFSDSVISVLYGSTFQMREVMGAATSAANEIAKISSADYMLLFDNGRISFENSKKLQAVVGKIN